MPAESSSSLTAPSQPCICRRAQKAMSRLTREERAALLDMQEQQGGPTPEATNRQMRRQLEKQKKRR